MLSTTITCASPKNETQGRASVNCLAKALYDNIAETPDELAFRKGDILTVLEQNTSDLEGWWLCSLRGRQGIAPGNRLRLMPGMYDPTGLGYTDGHSRRRSWQIDSNKVVTPHKIGDVYLYDVPAGTKMVDGYDVPPRHPSPHQWKTQDKLVSYDTPPSPVPLKRQGNYDEPRSHKLLYDVPRLNSAPSNISRPHTPSSDASSLGSAYDVPRSIDIVDGVPSFLSSAARTVQDSRRTNSCDAPSLFLLSVTNAYDVPSSSHPKYDIPSKHSSGISDFSLSSSSNISPSSSQASLNLSASSLCGSNRSSMEQQPQELYDVPPLGPHRPIEGGVTFAKTLSNAVLPPPRQFPTELYDIPTNNAPAQFYDTPNAPIPICNTLPEGVYDVPPQVTRDRNPAADNNDDFETNRFSASSEDLKDFPDLEGKELRLELDAAMEMLVKYHQEVHSAMIKLFSFISATWRKQEDLEKKMQDIRLACYRLQTTLDDFVNFVVSAVANSMHAADKSLSHKLAKLIKPVIESKVTVDTVCKSLDEKNWQIEVIVQDENSPDELDQLVACARNLVEDIRQVASFIHGNCTLIFKRSLCISDSKSDGTVSATERLNLQSRPLPPTPALSRKDEINHEIEVKEQINDYDYVNLESRESVERENEEIKAALPKELQKPFENLIKQSQIPVDSEVEKHPIKIQTSLDPNDQQLLEFYGRQVETHLSYLTDAIDAFLSIIENNQPPKVFIGHSKFVVISAHKLVYIGDTIYRNMRNNDIKNRTMQSANSLCDSLKSVVAATKKAALQFPSVVAVQEMVDSVVDVSHLANDLKVAILSAAKL